MNITNNNPNLPCLRELTNSRNQQRRISSSTNSKSTHSSSIPITLQNKNLISIPVPIQLCIYPDETYAIQTMKILFSSRYRYSPNVCDEFGCNVLMYSLRYQRFQLFNYLLNEISLDLNLKSKDRQGNNIIHYAVIYSKDNSSIMDNLIEKFKKFRIDIDERNIFGYTPLLLAMFCGRYDVVLSLLTKTDASPFVRDNIQSKNMIDYVDIDTKRNEYIKTIETNCQSANLRRESTRLRVQLHHNLPPRSESPHHSIQNHPYKNFFQNIFPQAVHDQSEIIRSSILQIFSSEYLLKDLKSLVNYLNQRYPRIKTPLKRKQNSQTKFIYQRENSNIEVHQIFNLYDPNLRPKAEIPIPKILTTQISQISTKQPITFKRLGAKLTVIAALSRPQIPIKTNCLITTTNTK